MKAKRTTTKTASVVAAMRNNLSRFYIMYSGLIRMTCEYLLIIALSAIIGICVVTVGDSFADRMELTGKLSQVESTLVGCLNGGAFTASDGSLINCEGIHSVKYSLALTQQ